MTPISRRKRRQGGLIRALTALILALAVHAVFVGVVLFLSLIHFGDDKPRAAKPTAVAMRPISPQQWAKNRGETKPGKDSPARPPPVAQKEAEKKKDSIRPDGQVVDTPPGNDQVDDAAKFLSENNNKVKKETRAKDQTAFYRNAMPQRTAPSPQTAPGQDNVDKAQTAGNDGLGSDPKPLKQAGEQKQAFEVPDAKRQQEVALKTDPTQQGPGANVSNQQESEEVKGNSNRLKIQPGAPGSEAGEASQGKQGAPGLATLLPSMAVVDRIIGAAPNDHLKDMDDGDGTFLNTKEWKFASFFNRVKQSVGMHWDPGGSLRQRDPTGNIFGGRDRYTVLSVTLNERGLVKEVFVEKSCGLDFLDLEAVKSFERAQPFPNPPPGLIASDSTVRFSFGFFLEMGGGPRMRLFRQSN